ncbi:MAG: sulfatase [bacterium]|nr:sulfatase [bacterium]
MRLLGDFSGWRTGLVALGLSVGAFSGCGSPTELAGPEPGTSPDTPETARGPQVVWVVLDACRAANLSCYGYDRETTPNIDRLAARGVLFERAFSQAHNTVYSVASYMTGRHFPVLCLGEGSWNALSREPPEGEILAPEMFRENGYETAAIGAHLWFEPGSRINRAFNTCQILAPPAGMAYAEFERINPAVFSWLDGDPKRPFFLYIHSLDTHQPHYVHAEHDQWIDAEYARAPDPSIPFSKKHREHLLNLYDSSLHYADACIGDLLNGLEARGLIENTIVVIASDHGEILGEDGRTVGHPGTACDEQFHVPLVMAGPGLPRGIRVNGLVENADILPTLLDLTASATTARMDGESLLPVVNGDVAAVHDAAFSRVNRVEDDQCRYLLLRNEECWYEYDPSEGTGALFSAPDMLIARHNVTDTSPEVAGALLNRVENVLIPKMAEYEALPHAPMSRFRIPVSTVFARPAEAFAGADLPSDGKWSLSIRKLREGGATEDCPPLNFRMRVPNGEYRVEVEIITQGTGSGLRLKAESDEDYITCFSHAQDKYSVFEELGVYRVTDEVFDVTVDDLPDGLPGRMSYFVFTPLAHPGTPDDPEHSGDRTEQMEALGYL